MDINNEPMINEEINDSEVRLIGRDGEQLGVMATRDAMAKTAPPNPIAISWRVM